MTSKLVLRAVEQEGLLALLAEREAGGVPTDGGLAEHLARADILVLGAAADIARRRENALDVSIFVPHAPLPSETTIVFGDAADAEPLGSGTSTLRRIAMTRLLGPIGVRIVVDWSKIGLEVAQLALSFGATDLAGVIASRRGLPMLDADDQKKLVKRRELAAFVERAGFRPVFVSTDDAHAKALSAQLTAARVHVDS